MNNWKLFNPKDLQNYDNLLVCMKGTNEVYHVYYDEEFSNNSLMVCHSDYTLSFDDIWLCCEIPTPVEPTTIKQDKETSDTYLLSYAVLINGNLGLGSTNFTVPQGQPITPEVIQDNLQIIKKNSGWDDSNYIVTLNWKRYENE